MIAIYPYQTQEVRDLAWACFSPTLLHARQLTVDGRDVADCGLALTPARQAWLEQLDRDATALHAHLSQRHSHRLGIYFERLWHFFLEQDPDVELVAHNLAVRSPGKTIGEFDCIYFCHQRQRHFHLELAVKYFLSHRQITGQQSSSRCSEWLGPNTQDRLDLKIEHLMLRQTQLGDTPQARELLHKLGIPVPDKEVVIKGYLFQSHIDALPAPHGFNHNCTLGQWLAIDALHTYLPSLGAAAYMILPRMKWLSSAHCENIKSHFCSDTLQAHLTGHFATDERPQLVAALDSAGWELQRFFVTAAGWPNKVETKRP